MLVEVVSADASDPQVVQFRCQAGGGAAVWRGSEPVAGGTSHHVEINHERALRWMSRGRLTDDSAFLCQLQATVESTGDGSFLALRLVDGLLMAQLADGESPAEVGTAIKLVDVALGLWPYDL